MSADLGKAVQDDDNVRAALEWFLENSGDSRELRRRIAAAQDFYRQGSVPVSDSWPDTPRLILPGDVIASYLAQADALLREWRVYDIYLGANVVPFIKHIGLGVPLLRQIEGARERTQRIINARNTHPDGGLWELVTAVRYAQDGYEVRFIPESKVRNGDLEIIPDGSGLRLQVECKRLRRSQYELRESALVRGQFARLLSLIRDRRLSIHIDVKYHQELLNVPQEYLLHWVGVATKSRLALSGGYPWRDEHGEGLICPSRVNRVLEDIEDSDLLFGSKMARLLSGESLLEGTYLMTASARPRESDPRYVETLNSASILSWHCLAPDSVNARARHITSKLAEIDTQLRHAHVGIAHIGMDAERDALAADLRRERNLEAVNGFRPESGLREVNLHYFLPRVAETAAWMIDETIDSSTSSGCTWLSDPRILAGVKPDFDSEKPAWHLPPPPPAQK